MKPLAAFLMLLSGQAAADSYPSALDLHGDTIQIAKGDGSAVAVVTYYNSISQVSKTDRHTLEIEGVIVDVWIRLLKDDARERVTVAPRDPGLVAYPSERDVIDGEEATIEIMVPMF